jgi:hypothetical protein
MYIQAELPNGEDAIKDPVGNVWRRQEFDRIVDTYGNHPSFVLMTMGNEAKIRDYTFLKELVQRGHKRDRRHLYATISNPEAGGYRDECPGDDFAVAHGSRRGRRRMEPYFNRNTPETEGDYRNTMVDRPVPQMSHETGQWYVYPDISEIEKYTGVLDPVTLKYFKEKLRENGLLEQARDFVEASGRLSLLLYKEEVERSLRTPVYGGFQLLGLQDSFDQGAAYVGQVNNFFEPKFYVTAEDFRKFCAPQVLLARFSKRVWLNSEIFKAKIELANYGRDAVENKKISWSVTAGGRKLAGGSFTADSIPATGLHSVGDISLPLSAVKKASKLNLSVAVEGTDIHNDWDLWVYPAQLDMPNPSNVIVTENMTPDIRKKLEAGARVVLLPSGFKSSYTTAMTPPFWSPIMFSNQKQSIGFVCDPNNPAFKDFPNDAYNNWKWFDLTKGGSSIRLTGKNSAVNPIVQAIDRPDRNDRLAIIYEGRVGKGSLLVCTLDLNRDLKNRPVARQLRRSLINYAAGRDFKPAVVMDIDENLPVGRKTSFLAGLKTKISADSEHENNWAIYAVDNNPDTIWHTRYDGTQTPHPHTLTVELEKPLTIKGIIQTPRHDGTNGRIADYIIYVSDDGKTWSEAASGKWNNDANPKQAYFSKPVKCRFIKLKALSEVNGNPWTTVAEFDVIL